MKEDISEKVVADSATQVLKEIREGTFKIELREKTRLEKAIVETVWDLNTLFAKAANMGMQPIVETNKEHNGGLKLKVYLQMLIV